MIDTTHVVTISLSSIQFGADEKLPSDFHLYLNLYALEFRLKLTVHFTHSS